ncbi:MAG TPA: alanine racemase [Marmoricola sp.]|nr:alanine racemase [Marmoricola sp.]
MSTAPLAEVVVDLDAIRGNLRRLRELVGTEVMAVVKADGYGHGMIQVARAAREVDVRWLGVATLDEALALRAAGDTGRLLCWLAAPDADYRPLITADIDVTAYTPIQVDAIAKAALEVGARARLQLKFDTGLSRGGASRADWQALIDAAAHAENVVVTGLWSHFASSDEPDHPANDAQETAFRDAVALARAAGLDPEVCHLANSAGALLRPSSRFDLVRFGIATYGLSPAPDVVSEADLGIRPAMTVHATVVMNKEIPEGAGVSYGHTFVAPTEMSVALIPLGYGDGIPRAASSRAAVEIKGARAQILGRVCMDQFVVGPTSAVIGDDAVLFGDGADGAPTAQDWARWCETIAYEIVTRMQGRANRRWINE